MNRTSIEAEALAIATIVQMIKARRTEPFILEFLLQDERFAGFEDSFNHWYDVALEQVQYNWNQRLDNWKNRSIDFYESILSDPKAKVSERIQAQKRIDEMMEEMQPDDAGIQLTSEQAAVLAWASKHAKLSDSSRED